MVRSKIFFITALLLLLLSSCNVPSEQTSTPTLTPGSTPTQTTNQTFTPTIQPEATATPIQTPAPPDHTTVLTLPSIADIVERIKPAVVYISVQYYDSSFLFRSWSTRSGSGVILNPDGYILTNNHVVEDASEIEVLLPDGEFTYKAEIIGTDPLSDLAVIKIDGGNFSAAGFADASKLRVGDWVIAMGSPVSTIIGAEGGPSVTIGIISNLERSFSLDESAFYDIIQTDAAINPGNSGGPLINLEGQVVGINTFIIYTAQNIGFAVSASTAQRVYEELVEFGKVIRPYLGVTLRTVTPSLAAELGLSRNRGVMVWYVEPESPAGREGLQLDDVITRFQDQDVADATRLIKLLWQYDVGDTVKLTYYRGSNQYEVEVTLAQRPD